MLSQTAEYALRAVLWLAEHGEGRPVRVGVLARSLDLPQNYLSKTLHGLVGGGVLVGVRGPAGGFRLARDPGRITLLAVVSIFDPIGARRECLLGRATCTDRNACPVHQAWKRTSESIARFFRTTTVADLIRPAARDPLPRRSA